MRAPILLVAGVVLLTNACISVDYTPLNPPPHPMVARSIDQVEIFEGSRPERPFVEVAAIEVQQRSSLQATSNLTEKLREEAAQRGCDGVIIVGPNDRTDISGSMSRGGGFVSSATLKGYRATCIVYKDAAIRSAIDAAAKSAAPAPAPMPQSSAPSTNL